MQCGVCVRVYYCTCRPETLVYYLIMLGSRRREGGGFMHLTVCEKKLFFNLLVLIFIVLYLFLEGRRENGWCPGWMGSIMIQLDLKVAPTAGLFSSVQLLNHTVMQLVRRLYSRSEGSLNGETSNSPKLFTKHVIKFHIWNHQRNLITTVS